MNMKESAWQHRSDLEQIDWEAICKQNEDPDYQKYLSGRHYREKQNKSRSRLNKINLLAGILLVALLAGWAIEMSKEGW